MTQSMNLAFLPVFTALLLGIAACSDKDEGAATRSGSPASPAPAAEQSSSELPDAAPQSNAEIKIVQARKSEVAEGAPYIMYPHGISAYAG